MLKPTGWLAGQDVAQEIEKWAEWAKLEMLPILPIYLHSVQPPSRVCDCEKRHGKVARFHEANCPLAALPSRIVNFLISVRVQYDDEAKEQKRELTLEVEQMTHFSGDFDAAPTERKRTRTHDRTDGCENVLFWCCATCADA